jgi:regulatory protein
MEEELHRKTYSAEIAWQKICKWCAYQERSQQDVRDKLYDFGLHRKEVEEMISRLITENFLNEERFAIAFAGGKFRQLGWGKTKIKLALKQKKVSEYCIRKALSSIDDMAYFKSLRQLIQKRGKLEKEKNPLRKNYKLAQYAISRGFEPDLVWDALKSNDE